MPAGIELLGSSQIQGAVTDFDGTFEVPGVPVGRQELRVSYLGYQSSTLSNILVTAVFGIGGHRRFPTIIKKAFRWSHLR